MKIVLKILIATIVFVFVIYLGVKLNATLLHIDIILCAVIFSFIITCFISGILRILLDDRNY
ncbi:MAG: hypothetical protein Ta2F_18720 [Termitinemataceae bacterium]|nr:MAG: hypothetical protein Ta2F_18720 [Termitinemataceae bacterium]